MERVLVVDSSEAVFRVRAGDTEAFGGIVECFQSPIIRYLCGLTGDAELARDLAQDTFVQAFKSLSKTTRDLPLKAWLYRIATNNALQHRRRAKRVSFVPLSDNPGEDAAESAIDTAAAQEALLKVPEKLRACMVLHFIDGFKYREIAETLGISEDAVRMRVARGSEAFRGFYRAEGDER